MSELKIENSKPEYLKYEADRVIFNSRTKVIDSLFIVLVGEVAIFESDNNRPGDKFEVIAPGNFLAPERFFSGTSPTRLYKATTETILLKIAADKVGQFLSDNYQIAAGLIISLAGKFANENKMRLEFQKLLLDAGLLKTQKNKALIFDNGIFPEGHKQYHIEAPIEHSKYLTEEDFICPSCKTTFKGVKQLTTLYKQKGVVGCDLRKQYHDISSIWYDIETCPECLFSFHINFYQTGGIIKQELKDILKSAKGLINQDFGVNRDLDAVFTGYYLAVLCADSYRAKYQIYPRLWRQLSWLYAEAGDTNMEMFAMGEAYEKCKQYYDHEDFSEESKQILFMIMGSIAKKLKKYDDAIRYLGEAKFCKTDKPLYKKIIELEIEEIKEIKG